MSLPTRQGPDLNIKGLVQSLISITIIQGLIFGLFIIIDPGFQFSLVIYFTITMIVSCIIVVWTHFKNQRIDIRERERSILDETDFAG